MLHKDRVTRLLLTLLLAVAVAIISAGCTSDETEPAADDAGSAATDDGGDEAAETETEAVADPTPIDFGYQNSLWGAPLILADLQGYWQEYNLDPNSQRFSAGKDVRDALLSGSAEAGSIGATPFIVAASTGEMKMIAVAGYLGDTVAIVVGADTGIETVEDLRGKNIATRSGSITELIFLSKVLPAFGMSEEDVNLRNVSFDDQVAALTTGEVDAFVGLEPFISIATTAGIGNAIITFGEYDMLPNIFAVSTGYLEENREAVVNMMRAYYETTAWIESDFDAASAALYEDFSSQGLELEEAALAAALANVDVNPLLSDRIIAYLDEQAQLLLEEGQITAVPDWDEVLAIDIQDEAINDYWANK